MTNKPMSGRERDRLARMKGRKPAARRAAPPKATPPPETKEETKPKEEAPATQAAAPPPPPPKPEPAPAPPPVVEDKKASPTPVASASKEEIKSPSSEASAINKETQPAAPPAIATPVAAKEPPKEAPKVEPQPAVLSSETKSNKMAENMENTESSSNGHAERDTSHLVENVSKKPLLYALLATIGVLAVVFLSHTFGPSHGGHEEGAEAASVEAVEGAEAASETEEAPMENESAPVSGEEESTSEGEQEAAPAAEEESSDQNEEGAEATSSDESGEVAQATPATSPTTDGKIATPFFGIATAAVDQENLAQKAVRDLEAKGLTASYIFIPDYVPNGKEMYRVFVGPYPTKDVANTMIPEVQAAVPGSYLFKVK